MSDFELTRLAYKAAFFGAELTEDKDMLRRWNPLTDDGDALRLAVKLGLTVCNEHLSAGVAYCTGVDGTAYPTAPSMMDTDDEINEADYAATRRAIVRAAAEIGKQMGEQS